jgi:hypothetical protein
MLYDLSKINYIRGQSGAIKNYWRVFPGDFKIRRSSDRPFTYKYSIEFTAVDFADDEKFDENILAPKLDFAKSALDKIRGSVEKLKEGMKYIDEVDTLLENLNSSIRDVAEILDAYADVLTGYVDGVTNMMDTANEIIKIPGDISAKALNIGLEFMNTGKRLLKSVEAISDTILSYGTSEFWAPQEVLDEYNMTATEYADTWADLCAGLEDNANTVVSVSKSSNLPTVTVGATQGTSAVIGEARSQTAPRQSVVLSYGDFAVTLASTDSLESLATEYCGSPDRAIDIAVYNCVASIDELNPGDTIKIPMFTPSTKHLLNRVYARPEDRDNYGRDIYLDNEGYTAASSSGDYLLTEGVGNLNQAILLRLRERVKRRIRLATYGIRTNISDPEAGVAYIISSIDLTVSRDPRVSAVDNIKFTSAGDGLDVKVEYTDINHSNGSTAGRA